MSNEATGPVTGSDSQRFAELWEKYAGRIQMCAMRHVDPETAQEVVSETFLVAWRRLAAVPGDPLPWLLVVARNTISNQRRSAYRRRLIEHELAGIAALARPNESADASTYAREDVLRALGALSQREREAVFLTAWDGLTPGNAATVAGCSLNAFNVRLSRARTHLSRAFEDPDVDEPRPEITPLAELRSNS